MNSDTVHSDILTETIYADLSPGVTPQPRSCGWPLHVELSQRGAATCSTREERSPNALKPGVQNIHYLMEGAASWAKVDHVSH